MKFVVKYWYLIVLAFVLSLVSACALLYIRRDVWIAPPPSPPAEESSDLPGMSVEYRKWNYQISAVEDLRRSLETERKVLADRTEKLEIEQGLIESERQDLVEMRKDLLNLRNAIESEMLQIDEAKKGNIKRLAKLYEVMKPDEAVSIFRNLDIELVVKIMSQMGEEPASKVLAEMSQGEADSPDVVRAVKITEIIQKVM